MTRPALPDSVRVLPGTDVERAWELFERFEALHHLMAICNPMSARDLDALVDALDPADGQRMIDLACGHGELLLRLAERADVQGTGVDLSPWVLARAIAEAERRNVAERLEWWVGDAAEFEGDGRYDAASALGSSWIWDDDAGTARALAALVRPEGLVAVGDLYRRPGVERDAVAHYGEVPTHDGLLAAFDEAGLDIVGEIEPSAASWDDYQQRIARSADAWVARHPSDAAQQYWDDQNAWASEHARDAELVGWCLRIGRRR